MKVHLVDGTYELYRAFYGTPPKQSVDGAEVGAVRGLLRSMLVLLAEPDVTHIAIAFDHVIESFRNGLYAGYKTGEGIDPALWSQFALAEDATRALGIVTWPMIEFEADDAIATAAARMSALSAVEQVVICSPDKDLTQCVRGERVVCRDRMRGITLTEIGVTEKFGVAPRRFRTGSRSSAIALMVFPASRAGGRSRPPPCLRCTRRSKRFRTLKPSGRHPCAARGRSRKICVRPAPMRCCFEHWPP